MGAIPVRLHWEWNARLELIFLRDEEENNGDERYKRSFHAGETFAGAGRFGEAGYAFQRREECAIACDRERYRSKRPEHFGRESRRCGEFGTPRCYARPPAAKPGANQGD